MSLPGRPVCGKLGRQDVKAGDSSLSVQRRLAKKKKKSAVCLYKKAEQDHVWVASVGSRKPLRGAAGATV